MARGGGWNEGVDMRSLSVNREAKKNHRWAVKCVVAQNFFETVKPHHKDDISCSIVRMDRIALAYKLHTSKQVLFFVFFCLVG